MRIEIKILNPNNEESEKINIFLIILLIILEVIAAFVFFTFSKIIACIAFILVLIGFIVLIEFFSEFFYLDTLKLEVKDTKLFVTLKDATNEFDLKSCDIEYHSDKDEWISLKNRNGQLYSWTLVKPVSKVTIKFIKEASNFRVK